MAKNIKNSPLKLIGGAIQALGAYDLQLEDLKAKARRVQAGGATTKKIEGMKSEFSKKMSAAEGKQTAALEKAAEKAEEEQKKAPKRYKCRKRKADGNRCKNTTTHKSQYCYAHR